MVVPCVERLERAIAGIPGKDSLGESTDPVAPAGPGPASALSSELVPNTNGTPASQSALLEYTLADGLLVKDGVSTRYINEVLLSRVLEKVSRSAHEIHPVSRPTYLF